MIDLPTTVARAFGSMLATLLGGVPIAFFCAEAPAQSVPVSAVGPVRIVFVRTTDSLLQDMRRFAQGLSASGLVGLPVCMLVDAELLPIQADLLRRLRDCELVCVGDAPAGLGERAHQAFSEVDELYEPSSEAVVASMHFGDQLPMVMATSTSRWGGSSLRALSRRRRWPHALRRMPTGNAPPNRELC